MLKNLQEILNGGVERALLRLWSSQLSEAEAAAIRSRAKADPGYREELLAALDAHAGTEGLADDPAIRAIADESAELSGLRRSQRRTGFGIAAGIVLAIGATLVYLAPWSGPDDSHLQRHFTRTGEQKTIGLDDGSAVTLNTATQRRVDAGWLAEFHVDRNELTAFQPESMDRYLGWRTGMLRFDREPLHRVVQELNRYARKKILIEDAAVMELSVYASVSVKELNSALDALEQLLAIEITEHYDRIVITGSEARPPARGAGGWMPDGG